MSRLLLVLFGVFSFLEAADRLRVLRAERYAGPVFLNCRGLASDAAWTEARSQEDLAAAKPSD